MENQRTSAGHEMLQIDATTKNRNERRNRPKKIWAELIRSACLDQRLGANTSNVLAERKEGRR
jgi:hypothetical protein